MADIIRMVIEGEKRLLEASLNFVFDHIGLIIVGGFILSSAYGMYLLSQSHPLIFAMLFFPYGILVVCSLLSLGGDECYSTAPIMTRPPR